MENYAFSEQMSVRDYECDLQEIVNNGVYQSHLEHVPHEYLKSIGIDFAGLAREGVNLVVVRAELTTNSRSPAATASSSASGICGQRKNNRDLDVMPPTLYSCGSGCA